MVIRRIDDLGRLQLPKDYRKTLDIHEGDELVIALKDGYMSVKKEEKKIGEEGMERYMKITGKAVIEYGLSENDFFIHDDACLLCGSLGVNKNKIDEMLRRINGFEAQQQEIDRLKDRNVTYVNENANQAKEIERLNEVLDDWKYNAKCDADHIVGLLADKDEQAGQIMRLEELAKDLYFAYINKDEDFPHSFETKAIEKYKALLGGAEDEQLL